MRMTRSNFFIGGVLLAACLVSECGLAQNAKLSLTTGALPPLTSAPGHSGFLDELVRAAFRRIGVEVEVSRVPPARSLINANAGLDDGDLWRIEGIEKDYPNLVRVPEMLLDNEFIAYTKRADIRIRDWSDLQPYAVAFVTGWKPYEVNVKGVKELTKVASLELLFPLLENGRVDVILMDRWQWWWVAHQNRYDKVRLIEWPLARLDEFMYLNIKHAALVPKVAQALADMKADGSYKKIYDRSLKPLDPR
jgi:polar amino acid transport system substrate-binding protein